MILAQQGSHMDFVGNVFGIMFIATLDDKDGEPMPLKDNVRKVLGLEPLYYSFDDDYGWDDGEDEPAYASDAHAEEDGGRGSLLHGEEALLGDEEE